VPRQPATVTIDVETCKGCVLCVDVCPPHVLVMSEDVNAMGYRYPLLLDGCTGCELCYKICPDYCFEVYRGAGSPRDTVARGGTREELPA
jgi:2-oxoglutarate ferredoxin oxidoreductase subunit delta